MSYLGDYSEDATLDFTFTSRRFTTGAPHTLAGTPALAVYKANSDVQSTAGITLTVDFDGVTGLNHVRIDLSADAFYATANDYSVVITVGTVDSVSVVGETVGTFSIEHRHTAAGSTPPTTGEIADAVWDEARAGHVGAGSFGQGVASVQGNVTGSVGSLAAQAKADVNAEAAAALVAIHLDHLLATTYDPASKPGTADALLNELIEDDGGVSRFTANALEQGPSGGGSFGLATVIDGLTFESIVEAIIASLFGKTTVSGNIVTFLKRDGTTGKVRVTYGTARGERSNSEIDPA